MLNEYEGREARFAERRDHWSRRSRNLSTARLIVFLVLVACAFGILAGAGGEPMVWIVGLVVSIVVFAVLIGVHDRVIRHERRFRDLAEINRNAQARLERRWNDMAPPPAPPSPEAPDLPLARDLHLFGHASLMHLLGEALTPPGRERLGTWLLEPAPPDVVRQRQGAVSDLAPEIDFRQELIRLAGELTGVDADVEPFLQWAEGESWLARRPWVRVLSFFLPGLLAATTLAWWFLGWPGSVPLLLLWINLAVTVWLGGEVPEIFDRIALREGKFKHYAALFEHLAGRIDGLEASGRPAHQWLEILHKRVVWSDTRHSALLHFFVQAALLWDFHVLARLEAWQRDVGNRARGWMEVLAETEALAALAGLAYDEPEWTLPEIVEDGSAVFEAEGLGHPLLSATERVANDVTLGPPGTFLLVTGSNMSGKSTLLRAVGVNVVLAQAGGPACARRLRLPPLVLGTSILIEDSLESGISFFMAELLRLREIVEAARRSRSEGRTLLYLLDEVLRGTNSRERRLAARSILRHLLEVDALGAVSTHDAALLEVDDLQRAAHAVHFRETVHPEPGEGPVMTFDYRLKEGVATGGNAMRLLELVGLQT